jgi:hypothetical protein
MTAELFKYQEVADKSVFNEFDKNEKILLKMHTLNVFI